MPALRELQLQFAAAVFDEPSEAIANQVLSNGLSSARRLRVYHHNIFASLSDALRAVFPVIEKLVGADFFGHVAHSYITAHPSHSGNLQLFGANFANYLTTFAGLEHLYYLGDVAHLEWRYHEVFHAASHAPLALDQLGAVAPADYDALRFTLHPAARLVASPYPILKIWLANQSDAEGAEEINIDSGSAHLLVIRRDLDIEFESLSVGAYTLLTELYQGARFDDASTAALSAQPDCDIALTFQYFVMSKVLVDFTLHR